MGDLSPSSSLFGSVLRTKVLLTIHLLEETHASEIAAILQRSLSRIQDKVDSFEKAGVIVAVEEGHARRIRLNPRFAAAEELRALLQKLGMQDIELQQALATRRRRPRRKGKEI